MQTMDQLPMATATQMECGDLIAPFALPDHEGKSANLLADDVTGKPALLVFECDSGDDGAAYARELAALRDHAKALTESGASVFAITRRSVAENQRLHAEHNLPFRILSDSGGEAYRACGMDPLPPGCPTITIVVDPNFRAVRAIGGGEAGSHAPQALAQLVQLEREYRRTQIGTHPPVLVLPRALTPADCARLIQIWHRPVPIWKTDGLSCEGFDNEKGDFKAHTDSFGNVSQLVVRDPHVQEYLDIKLRRRVMPEIRKTFQTKVSRREVYRIAGYDASEGGELPAHRDNSTAQTQQRRFTMSVTLNAGDFSGGGLRFPEYGGQEYLVPTGTAIIWSCALLHEVLPVTAGHRFILGTHLFGT